MFDLEQITLSTESGHFKINIFNIFRIFSKDIGCDKLDDLSNDELRLETLAQIAILHSFSQSYFQTTHSLLLLKMTQGKNIFP